MEEFDQMVSAGRKVVILDDLVLDVEKFMSGHPGGKFTIEHNIGRDISKFFYGGYSLENIDKVAPYSHSTDAIRAVNSLIIGRLTDEAPVKLTTIEVDSNANLSGSCKNIRFKEKADRDGSARITDLLLNRTDKTRDSSLPGGRPCSLIDIR